MTWLALDQALTQPQTFLAPDWASILISDWALNPGWTLVPNRTLVPDWALTPPWALIQSHSKSWSQSDPSQIELYALDFSCRSEFLKWGPTHPSRIFDVTGQTWPVFLHQGSELTFLSLWGTWAEIFEKHGEPLDPHICVMLWESALTAQLSRSKYKGLAADQGPLSTPVHSLLLRICQEWKELC